MSTQETELTTPGEWAAAYTSGAALVLPLHTPTKRGCSCMNRGCKDIGKHPRTQHGKDDATSNDDTVVRWWGMWPAANIGIRPHSGQVVLDVDPRNGGDVQLAAMQEKCGPLPKTRTARTGSGGLHIWLALGGDVVGELAPGIDVKTNTGYLVAPPSVHESGGAYEWIDTGPIADAPSYLVGLLRKPERVRTAPTGTVTPAVVEGLARKVRTATNGERNRLLYWACCRAVEKGIPLDDLVDAAVGNGLTQREAERTALSAERAAAIRGDER